MLQSFQQKPYKSSQLRGVDSSPPKATLIDLIQITCCSLPMPPTNIINGISWRHRGNTILFLCVRVYEPTSEICSGSGRRSFNSARPVHTIQVNPPLADASAPPLMQQYPFSQCHFPRLLVLYPSTASSFPHLALSHPPILSLCPSNGPQRKQVPPFRWRVLPPWMPQIRKRYTSYIRGQSTPAPQLP